jgi:hypothetical protein
MWDARQLPRVWRDIKPLFGSGWHSIVSKEARKSHPPKEATGSADAAIAAVVRDLPPAIQAAILALVKAASG